MQQLRHPAKHQHRRIAVRSLNTAKPELDKIKVPTTIIWSKSDSIFPEDDAKVLSKGIRKSRVIITDGTHLWPLLHHESFARLFSKSEH